MVQIEATASGSDDDLMLVEVYMRREVVDVISSMAEEQGETVPIVLQKAVLAYQFLWQVQRAGARLFARNLPPDLLADPSLARTSGVRRRGAVLYPVEVR